MHAHPGSTAVPNVVPTLVLFCHPAHIAYASDCQLEKETVV